MTAVPAHRALDALTIPIELAPMEPAEIVTGSPSSGTMILGEYGPAEVGIWEISPGVVTDVEADEVFVVLAGRATIEFTNTDEAAIQVAPGSVVRLRAGTGTRWHVHERLRKVYIA